MQISPGTLSPGTPFADRYRIDAEVGRGTFGIVYRAYDFAEARDVAIKVLNAAAASDATLKQRLRREAKLMREMKSSHCVDIYAVDETADGAAYIVMELLLGEELHELISRLGRIEPGRTTAIALEILEAVGESHDLGVVHRDLKPHNVFICRAADGSDDVKVLDFGIAKITNSAPGTGITESSRLTMHGTALGTPVYMSPEQCRGGVPTPASDIYSLGVMLYEMLTGSPPFDDENPIQVLMKHNSDPVPPLPKGLATTPVGRATMRALEKDPDRRFATAQEFAAALGGPGQGGAGMGGMGATAAAPPVEDAAPRKPETIRVRLSAILQGVGGSSSTGTYPAVEGDPPDGPSRRTTVWLTAAAIGAIIAAVVLAFLF